MRIALNLLPVIPGRSGGQETYACGVVEGLQAVSTGKHEFVLLTNQYNHDLWPLQTPNFSKYLVRLPCRNQLLRVMWEQFVLPLILYRLRVNVVHSVAGVSLVFARCANVVTIHDLLYLRYPGSFSSPQRWYRRLLFPYTARKASHIVVDSKYTRNDLCNHLSVSRDRVSVVYLGVQKDFRRISAEDTIYARRWEKISKEYRICKPYVLYVGSMVPHKNLKGLLRATAICLQDGYQIQLVLLGPGNESGSYIVEKLGIDKTHPWIIRGGYVPTDDLVLFYNRAAVHVLPSLFEGFGLTVLEAMACGCPVVASNRASIPEVVGEAGILVDPENPEDMASAISAVLSDSGLRARLVEAGLTHVNHFSWGASGCRLIEIYEQCYSG